jgi:aspartate-semialdehyde dehydrogenase
VSERRPVAILGAGGYIGQHFARLLAEHPEFEVEVLAGGDRSSGQRLGDVWHLAEPPPADLADRTIQPTTPARLARGGVRIVFSALPSGTAGTFETECARRGLAVFSNAADHRMDRDVPLLVPEVNPEHLHLLDRRPSGRGPLVTNANCSTTGLVLGLAPIARVVGIRTVHVATYQALSGAGHPGVPSLGIMDNVVPFISHEEEKMAEETDRILGRLSRGRVVPATTPVLAHCARVAVRDGHLEAVTVEARRSPALGAILEAWRRFDPLAAEELPTAPHPPVELRSERDRPQPLKDRWAGSSPGSRGMTAVVGRVRWHPPFLRFFLLSHNAVRGGAGGSVLNAELALRRGYLGSR